MESLIPKDFDHLLKLTAIIGGLVTFIWSVWVWRQNQIKETENKRVEANKPFLELQLKMYMQVTEVASIIAASENETETTAAIKSFWKLYYGQLSLFETEDVAEAMRQLGDELLNTNDRELLQKYAINLASCCRTSLSTSWNTEIWTTYSTDKY